jgi:hypothetical protein
MFFEEQYCNLTYCSSALHLLVHRFLLTVLGMLTGNHYGNEISLIINSGVLAVIQSLMRQMGKYLGEFVREVMKYRYF